MNYAKVLLWLIALPVWAEERPLLPPPPPPSIAVDTAKTATPKDIPPLPKPPDLDIKDPTIMPPRFREAVKHMEPATTGKSNGASERTNLPKIRLVGKSQGGHRAPSALLQVDTQTFLVQQGSQLSLPSSTGEGVTLKVESISESCVQLMVLPLNKRIFLY